MALFVTPDVVSTAAAAEIGESLVTVNVLS